jgi:hypothetical protein
MDELLLVGILRKISIFVSIVGILAGVDLLLGVRVISALKRILDKAVDFDKMIIDTKIRIFLGVLFLVISILMILVIKL